MDTKKNSTKTPEQITQFILDNQYRMDSPQQYYGDEPNTYRKVWDSTTTRWCIVASWPYEAAAGNQAIPLVYKSINIAGPEHLADRFYLPGTPRDLRMLEKAGIPVFGVESRHGLLDFDVIGSSISYPLLILSYFKMLKMSGIPLRWRDREEEGLERYPMVMVGGQSYGAPEALAPVVDVWWLGEVEDEPGNPGIAAVTRRIAQFKAENLWQTNRLECYGKLAREFSFLYFPRFVDVHYGYEDRSEVMPPGAELSKQVMGYTSNLEGMRLPFKKRIVKDLDAVVPLDNPPLLYVDPGLGSGDIETGRGCPAWAVNVESLVQTTRGTVRADQVQAGDLIKSSGQYRRVDHVWPVRPHESVVVRTKQGAALSVTPEHEFWALSQPRLQGRRSLTNVPRQWIRADALQSGDFLEFHYGKHFWPPAYVQLESEPQTGYDPYAFPTQLTPSVGRLLGMIVSDATVRPNVVEFRLDDSDPEVAESLQAIILGLFGKQLTMSHSEEGPSTTFRANSARLVRWLGTNFGIKPHDQLSRKVVPAAILQSPRDVVAEFMSGLYDGNGSHRQRSGSNRVSTIEFTTYSEEQARGIAVCLSMLGLPPVVRRDWRDKKRSGEPADSPKYKYEIRHTSPADGDYTWLRSLSTKKTVDIENWRGSSLASARYGVHLHEVVAVESGPEIQTIDLSVPGNCSRCAGGDAEPHGSREAHSFNIDGGIIVSNCSFCDLTYRQKPYRQRSVEYMVDFAKNLTRNVGSAHLSPFSPDFPMHTQRRKLIAGLLENVSDEVDASTMRVDDFIADPDYILLQVHGGMDTVTLGVEGNSQRMRDLVGKGAADEDIKEAVARGIRAGIRRFKLYMISNLPGEDAGDIFRIMKLAKDLADIRDSMGQPGVRIQFSWTPLLIGANTPFQWFAPPISGRSSGLADVWDEFRGLKIEFKLGGKAEPNRITLFQLINRASREVGEAILDVCDAASGPGQGATWGGVPKTTRADLQVALRARGFHNGLDDCFDERFKHDLFGWEFIDQGISTELLWVTYVQTREFVEQTDSDSYDLNFGDDYHGNEWIERCDTRCYGKSQPSQSSHVLTPTGFVKMGDLQVGDAVVDPRGGDSHVVQVFPQGKVQSYRVSFSDGSSTLASADHLWAVTCRTGTGVRVEKTLTTEEVARTIGTWVAPYVVEAPSLSVTDLGPDAGPVDPYLLGLLLGDASMTFDHTMSWGSADDQLTESVRSLLPDGVYLRQVSDRPSNFKEWAIASTPTASLGRHRNILVTRLRELGVFGKRSIDKFVPDTYKLASAATRLAVLQGLMDTDGGRDNGPSQCSTTVASRAMRDDVVFLARSLGFRVVASSKWVEGIEYYRASIYERPELPRLFRLERKLPLLPERFGKVYGRAFVSVELEGTPEEHQCILVSAASSLYVTDDFVPTHNTCGVCDVKDLQIRRRYIQDALTESKVDLSDVKVVDQRSVAFKVRARIVKDPKYRFVMNDHWRFAVRRAAFTASDKLGLSFTVTKRTIKFASDEVKFRDWTAGVDYLEFGLTKDATPAKLTAFIEAMNKELSGLQLMRWAVHPTKAASMRSDVDLSLWDLEIDVESELVLAKLKAWHEAEYVKMVLKTDAQYFAMGSEEVNAKDFCDDVWLVRDGHRLVIRMLLRGRPSPYNVYAALMGRASWLEAAKKAALKVDAFVTSDSSQFDFFNPMCTDCSYMIPTNVLDEPYDPERCPRCKDRHDGIEVTEVTYA